MYLSEARASHSQRMWAEVSSLTVVLERGLDPYAGLM